MGAQAEIHDRKTVLRHGGALPSEAERGDTAGLCKICLLSNKGMGTVNWWKK